MFEIVANRTDVLEPDSDEMDNPVSVSTEVGPSNENAGESLY